MADVLNSIIKFDLHIHSKASEYKESAGIVDNSTKENLGVLLTHLNNHQVALFSITDHNRFDSELYVEINRILTEPAHPYPNVKGVLAGVEFDVILDEGMDKCHIIAIFDTNNDEDELRKIEIGINTNKLTAIDAAYSKDDFEDVLKAIGLNAILIASQRKDIHNHSGKHNSLSDSTLDVEQIIRVGYINALEFQKPKVEGILLNSLKTLSLPITLFSGSDCHDWTCYPFHDKHNQNKDFHHSKAKILPTFKGLLMAITSPETRFNRSESANISIIDEITIKDQTIPLVNGLNAIIGENGSGKTTLLKVINRKLSEAHVKKLVRDNDLKASHSIDPQKVKYIEQGQIIKKFNEKTLFSAGDESNFKDLDDMPFREAYTTYSNGLRSGITAQIYNQEAIDALSKHVIIFQEGMTAKNYFIDVTGIEAYESITNPHDKARGEIKTIYKKLLSLLDEDYYQLYKEQLERISAALHSIVVDIESNWSEVDFEANAKNILHGCMHDYLRKVKENSSAKDREIKEYNQQREQVIDVIFKAIKVSMENITWPICPAIMEGATKNPKQGFYFNREAAYNGVSMLESFFSKMFVKNYSNVEQLQTIKTYDQLATAIRTCTTSSEIKNKWDENFEKFINDAVKTSDYIMDGANQQIGNTLGEMSLSYYKFFTKDNQDWKVLIVDQPEDNISNNNISNKLLKYFNEIRDEKQIIFVTHNPLLVVNLDVDNVVYIKNNSGVISASSGCLEYEDEETNILELIAQNMDGGKETIEKRLRVYGKSH